MYINYHVFYLAFYVYMFYTLQFKIQNTNIWKGIKFTFTFQFIASNSTYDGF
jgi:hypothetical protein